MRSAEGNGAGGGRELSRGSSPPFQKKKAERERERGGRDIEFSAQAINTNGAS